MPAFENPNIALAMVSRAKAIAAMEGDRAAGEQWLRAAHVGDHTLRIYAKAAVPASTFPDAVATSAGYIESLRNPSAAVRVMLDNGFRRVAFNEPLFLVTSAPTASVPGQGRSIPVSRVVFGGEVLTPRTSGSIIAPTKEMIRDTSTGMLNAEIAGTIGAKLDADFFATLVGSATDAPVVTSAGPQAADAMQDFREAVLSANALGTPRLYWVMGKEAIKMVATLSASGVPVFPSIGMTGGELFGATAIVSSGIEADAIYLLEGSCIAANIGAIEVVPGPSADLEMSDAPAHDGVTPIATQLVSAWQNNLLPLRGSVVYGALAIRSNAIVKIENVDYGGS